jgi:hypothetical protein
MSPWSQRPPCLLPKGQGKKIKTSEKFSSRLSAASTRRLLRCALVNTEYDAAIHLAVPRLPLAWVVVVDGAARFFCADLFVGSGRASGPVLSAVPGIRQCHLE